MRKHMRRGTVLVGKDAKAEAAALDDGWVWGVIFATTGLSALALATLFTVATG